MWVKKLLLFVTYFCFNQTSLVSPSNSKVLFSFGLQASLMILCLSWSSRCLGRTSHRCSVCVLFWTAASKHNLHTQHTQHNKNTDNQRCVALEKTQPSLTWAVIWAARWIPTDHYCEPVNIKFMNLNENQTHAWCKYRSDTTRIWSYLSLRQKGFIIWLTLTLIIC